MKLLSRLMAQDQMEEIFGKVDSPVGGPELSDPGTGLTKIITTSIQIALFIGGLLLLIYLFYGAFLWITSGGEPEKTEKARNVLTQAIIGILLLVLSLTIFVVVAGDVLNIIRRDDKGDIYFDLPSIRDESGGETNTNNGRRTPGRPGLRRE
ncbi:MAG: hypothetical protein ACOCXQ_02185 [Patescibacteria group bacterium]